MPQALKLYGVEYSTEELYKIATEDVDFYKVSGGGVTCSGGEPLMQAGFIAEFLSMCKGGGFHTAVDTSGYAAWQAFEKLMPYTDLFLYDIKHMDPFEHKRLTGMGNRLILDNLIKLSQNGAAVEIRIPVVPSYNDGEQNILQTAQFLKSIATLTKVRLLPYHALAGSKYASIGKGHSLPAAEGEGHDAVKKVYAAFDSMGLPVYSTEIK